MANRMPQGKKAKIVEMPKQEGMTKEQYQELLDKYGKASEVQDMHYRNAVENLESDIKVVAKTYGSVEGVRAVFHNDVCEQLSIHAAALCASNIKTFINGDILPKFYSTKKAFEFTDCDSKIWSSYLDDIIDYDFAENHKAEIKLEDRLSIYREFVEKLVIKDLYARFGQAGHDIDVQWQKDQEMIDDINKALDEAEKSLDGPRE